MSHSRSQLGHVLRPTPCPVAWRVGRADWAQLVEAFPWLERWSRSHPSLVAEQGEGMDSLQENQNLLGGKGGILHETQMFTTAGIPKTFLKWTWGPCILQETINTCSKKPSGECQINLKQPPLRKSDDSAFLEF